jgi:hypothetical protein
MGFDMERLNRLADAIEAVKAVIWSRDRGITTLLICVVCQPCFTPPSSPFILHQLDASFYQLTIYI